MTIEKECWNQILKKYATDARAESIMDDSISWYSLTFLWRLFLYFWVWGILGHFLEVVWVLFTHDGFNPYNIPTITPLAVPYGLSTVAVILLISPIYKKFKHPNILLIFIFSTIVTCAVELLSAVIIVAFCGDNPFWNYSAVPYNFHGYICLKNVLIFGLVATIFIHFVFPLTERFIKKHSARLINDLSVLLFTTYIIDLLILVIGGIVRR